MYAIAACELGELIWMMLNGIVLYLVWWNFLFELIVVACFVWTFLRAEDLLARQALLLTYWISTFWTPANVLSNIGLLAKGSKKASEWAVEGSDTLGMEKRDYYNAPDFNITLNAEPYHTGDEGAAGDAGDAGDAGNALRLLAGWNPETNRYEEDYIPEWQRNQEN